MPRKGWGRVPNVLGPTDLSWAAIVRGTADRSANSQLLLQARVGNSYTSLLLPLSSPSSYYRHPPIIRCWGEFRTTPMALAKRLVLLGWNFACMPLWAKLADSSRRFLISALEAEIWVPLGGWHGGPKITKNFFPNLSFFGQNTYIEMFYDRLAQKMTIFGRFSRF